MPFTPKTWKDRVSDYPLRRKLAVIDSSGETQEELLVDVAREEGLVREPGNQFSAFEMNDLEERIRLGITTVQEDGAANLQTSYTALTNQHDADTKALNTKITNMDTNFKNTMPIRRGNFTLTVGGWTQYSSGGQTLFRQSVTGLTAGGTDRFEVSTAIEYLASLYSDIIPVNNNGALTVTTAIKPTVNIPIQLFLTPTRSG